MSDVSDAKELTEVAKKLISQIIEDVFVLGLIAFSCTTLGYLYIKNNHPFNLNAEVAFVIPFLAGVVFYFITHQRAKKLFLGIESFANESDEWFETAIDKSERYKEESEKLTDVLREKNLELKKIKEQLNLIKTRPEELKEEEQRIARKEKSLIASFEEKEKELNKTFNQKEADLENRYRQLAFALQEEWDNSPEGRQLKLERNLMTIRTEERKQLAEETRIAKEEELERMRQQVELMEKMKRG